MRWTMQRGSFTGTVRPQWQTVILTMPDTIMAMSTFVSWDVRPRQGMAVAGSFVGF